MKTKARSPTGRFRPEYLSTKGAQSSYFCTDFFIDSKEELTMKSTIAQELSALQTSLNASIRELDKAPGTREALAAPYMRADGKAKVARQIINAAQALIRISRIKAEGVETASGAKR